jgi:hypothetical protein
MKSHLFRDTHANFFGTREGKRTAEEEAEEFNVKKARVDGDEDVMMASVTEPSASKCNFSYLRRPVIGTNCYRP